MTIIKNVKGFYIYAFFSCLAAFNSLLKLVANGMRINNHQLSLTDPRDKIVL